ncbi:carbohydrate kinase family protein [Streptomyces lunaelactis]|uniref:Carbohydrate kinase family protein n=1 Tax=Streptomyces lunaelactis TaxID=1535768 RepID=A0A2R4TFA6_9ACTN|nr:carbohydrate kinase family protein [Streptomyces lunaelactis]AVZ77794.1 carbohydrate kinase family protein [Streptomyces lunaelactis]NUK83572.1 carbohydrate kinase family protein [Streptomyces lunaelactis]
MRIAVTGSIATDHLMVFPGRFTEQLIAGSLDKVSLSFLVEELQIRRGGVAANIAFGLGRLGLGPYLVGAVGTDFADYEVWLKENGVDTGSVHISESLHTARFVCTSDADHNQIGSFYAGAMSEARTIELRPVHERAGGLDLVVISPNDPEAMVRHTRECADLAVPFAADPSQQLAFMGREEVRELLAHPAYLFTNEYESVLLQEKTGWTEQQILGRVGTWVTTRGADGVHVERAGLHSVDVPSVPPTGTIEPTGAGDAFRAGFLAATAWGLGLKRAAQLGSALATTVLETTGTQPDQLNGADLLARVRGTYGTAAAGQLAGYVAPVARHAVAAG